MSDETRMNEAETAAEEQVADETSTQEEDVPQAVAEAEMAAEEQAADDGTPAAEESAPQAEAEAATAPPAEERTSPKRVEGPANFNRAKQGNQRRNPRHVGSDVRIDEINYKNVQVLSRFVDNYGRIFNRRKTRVTAKMQRKVTRAVKRARHLALMPFTGEHIRITGRRG